MTKKNILIVFSAVIALAIASYFYFGNSEDGTYNAFVVASRKNIVQEVSVTGRVNPASNIELAFEKSGKIKKIYVEVGSRVYAWQTMIELENGDATASLAAAKATLKASEAKLAEMKAGARAEELAISETKVKNAESALDDAEKTLTDWQISLSALNTEGDLNAYVAEAGNNLEKIKKLLEKISLAVNSLTSGASLSQSTIDGWKTDISTARTNINTAVGNLSAANEKLRSSLSALNLTKDELTLTKAGPTPEAISSQEAALKKPQADVAAAVSSFEKTILRSPVSGTVSKIDADAGEIVQASVAIAGVISNAMFKIEADIPEADIAKIKTGDEARVSLDAYGSGTF